MSQALLALKNEAAPSRSASASRGSASGLRITAPGDTFEHEADRVADQVMAADRSLPRWSLSKVDMRTPLQRKCACGGSSHEEGECDSCKEKKKLQRKATAAGPDDHAPAIVDDVLSTPGQPLDAAAREFFEHRFGHDFSGIRIHSDAAAERSAKAVHSLAYTVGNRIVFSAGQYAPQTTEGRRLIAHELVHAVQQGHSAPSTHRTAAPGASPEKRTSAALSLGPASTITRTAHLQVARQVGPQTQAGGTAPPAVRIVRLDNNVIAEIGRGNAAVANTLRQLAENPGVKLQMSRGVYIETTRVTGDMLAARKALIQKLKIEIVDEPLTSRVPLYEDYAKSPDFPTHGQPKVTGSESYTLEDLPHLASARAGGPDVELWSFDTRVQTNAGRLNVKIAPESHLPILKNVPDSYTNILKLVPEVTAADIAAAKGQPGVKPGDPSGGQGAAADNEPAGQGGKDAPGTNSVKVKADIEVKNVVKNPDGSTVSELEYNFGENLQQLNQGAPPGSEIPARITMRITSNAEGAITSVESLSGEPAALVEALARQTLSQGLSGEAGGLAGAGRLANVTKGLKIAGWAAFVVITGYQLYKATPAQRPRVLAQAAGGLAGSALAGFGVCNLLLDVETAGWGILICGLIAGGAGGYAGSEAGGAIYDEATATEMDHWLKEVDQREENERVLFNILVGSLGTAANCIKPQFVMSFLDSVPTKMKDYEVVLVAGQVANAAVPGVRPAANTKAAPTSNDRAHASHEMPVYPKPKGTTCPSGCHGENRSNNQPTLGPLNPKEIDAELEAIKNAPTCDAILGAKLDALRAAIRKLPEAPPPYPPSMRPNVPPTSPFANAPAANSPADRNSFPTVQQQKGKDVCPSCHREVQQQIDQSLLNPQFVAPKYEPLQPVPDRGSSDRKTPIAPPPGNAHATPPGVHFPAAPQGFPSVQEQQGQSCPTCHKSLRDTSGQGWMGGTPGMGSGGSSQITNEQRKAMEDWIAAENK